MIAVDIAARRDLLRPQLLRIVALAKMLESLDDERRLGEQYRRRDGRAVVIRASRSGYFGRNVG
jgi:hypothetical protein